MRKRVNPQARAILEEISAASPDGGQPLSIEELRRLQLVEARFFGEPEAVKTVRDVRVNGEDDPSGFRLYFPDAPAPHPIVMFIRPAEIKLGRSWS